MIAVIDMRCVEEFAAFDVKYEWNPEISGCYKRHKPCYG